VQLALERNCRGIAWTYNEPTIWFEYTYDSAILAKEAGLYTVYVTNGYMTSQALEKIGPYLDAANVDVKGFSKRFYNGVCKARLDPVLKTCEGMQWAAGVDRDLPVHFSRFHPDWRMLDRPATPIETLERAQSAAARAGLRYVYLGNISSQHENTFCPECGAVIVERTGYTIKKQDKQCPGCGREAPIVDQ
jgi:pyruvate formate lyase activating enzyme